MPVDSLDLARTLRDFREKHNLSRAILAEHLGISRRTIEHIEVGRVYGSEVMLRLALMELDRVLLLGVG